MMSNISLGFIRIHILHYANEGEIFGVENQKLKNL